MATAMDDHDAVGLAQLVRDGEVTPEELVEDAISRVERLNPRLNAIIHSMHEDARANAGRLPDGPLRGVPFVIKDLGPAVKGQPFTRGSKFCRQVVAGEDSELTRRYRAAGLCIVGKTNTPELGLLPVTEPEAHGPTENPWAIGRTAGGSSGGSAAAVAAGIVPVGHANDGGGSIRIPAACCGLFGLKPTRARVPVGPDASESWFGFACDHVVSRTVRDSAALLDASHGLEPTAAYAAPPVERPFLEEVGAEVGRLRVALCTEPIFPSTPEPVVVEAARDTARLLEELGHEVVEVRAPVDGRPLAGDFTRLICVATACDLVELGQVVGRPPTRTDVELTTWLTAMIGEQLDAKTVERARRNLQAAAREVAGFMKDFNVLLTPTLGMQPVEHFALRPPPVELGAYDVVARARLGALAALPKVLEHASSQLYQFIPWTPLANFTGQPSMSLPLSMSPEGLPLGVMFTGRFGDEAGLFRLAAQLERARPWQDRRPPIHA